MKTYYVTYKVEGRYVVKVEADSLDDAKNQAQSAYLDADFGELSDIDGMDIFAEDDDGNYVWER